MEDSDGFIFFGRSLIIIYSAKATKFWDLYCRFVLCSASQIYIGDFAKFCGLLRISELYIVLIWIYI